MIPAIRLRLTHAWIASAFAYMSTLLRCLQALREFEIKMHVVPIPIVEIRVHEWVDLVCESGPNETTHSQEHDVRLST